VIVKSKLRRKMRELGIHQATPEAVEIISAILERQAEELLRRIAEHMEYSGRRRLDKELLEVMGLW